MDRIFPWIWDRFGARYSWMICAFAFVTAYPVYLFLAIVVVALEDSSSYLLAVVAAVVMVALLALGVVLPGHRVWRLAERWARGQEVDRAATLAATYTWSRGAIPRSLVVTATLGGGLLVITGLGAGADGIRLAQYAFVGAVAGGGAQLIGVHTLAESPMRPVRIALAGDADIGDGLPRSRPSFATWSNLSVVAVALGFGVVGAMCAAAWPQVRQWPILAVVIGGLLALAFGVPIVVGVASAPALRPIQDLAEGTRRVAAGDYTRRLPVVQDDDLGALAASFNRMQAGLAERQRLHAAFGTYVDPVLTARLLGQGDDVFTGERREVTVMFVDIRDFTPYAEANSAEDTVARLNALFGIVAPAVVDAGGHVNKFLGDGALAVFGAPDDLAGHADAAVAAAVAIQQLVAERFGGGLRIGIGINTGVVIAGTIGGGGKLEFTLIGDTVNVAARVEELTKTTGDSILLTAETVEALRSTGFRLIDRGVHTVRGKSAVVNVFGLDPAPR